MPILNCEDAKNGIPGIEYPLKRGWLFLKRTGLMNGDAQFNAAIGRVFVPNVVILIASRVVGGVGIGISTVAAPLYIL